MTPQDESSRRKQRKLVVAQPARQRILLALAWYSVAIHRGITKYAQQSKWILDGGFVRTGYIPDGWEGDGVIAVLGMHPELDNALLKIRKPMVAIGYNGPSHIPRVCADSVAIGRMAAEHFLKRGFVNFAFYDLSHSQGEQMRDHGFGEVIQQAGHVLHHIDPLASNRNRAAPRKMNIYKSIAEALIRLPKPIAVFAEYDDRAIEVVEAATSVGLRVPEQVAVLGVNNDELRCPFATVPLSSIDSDEEKIGFEAARLLDSMIRGRPAPNQPIEIPPKGVIVRHSTDVLAIPDSNIATALRLIWEHYTEPIDAVRVAQHIPMSYPKLHEAFVRYVGHSMAEEIARKRIEHAQRLLSTSDTKMTEVARLTGFGSADRMTRTFVRKLKLTPSEYREHASLQKQNDDQGPSAAESQAD